MHLVRTDITAIHPGLVTGPRPPGRQDRVDSGGPLAWRCTYVPCLIISIRCAHLACLYGPQHQWPLGLFPLNVLGWITYPPLPGSGLRERHVQDVGPSETRRCAGLRRCHGCKSLGGRSYLEAFIVTLLDGDDQAQRNTSLAYLISTGARLSPFKPLWAFQPCGLNFQRGSVVRPVTLILRGK